MAGTILYKLSLDATKFETGLKTAERQLQKTAASFSKVGKSLSTYVTAPLMGMATAAVMAFDTQAKAVAQVEAGLKSTGQAAGFTSKELQKMASDLQKNTLFGDEEILKNATAQLLTFTNLAGDQFKMAQNAALDLATRLDGDLKSASIMVGKALNDPIKGLSAMGRAGVQFSAEQQKVIKTLAQTGRLAEAQTMILGELEKQYGGSAEAAVVGAGKMIQLKNAVGDLMEQFGAIVTQYLDPLIARIMSLTERLANMSEDTKRSIVKWAAFAAALGPVIFVVGKIIALFAGVAKAIRLINAAFLGNPIVLAIAAIVAAIAALIFFIASVKDSIYAFYGYFDVTLKRVQIAFIQSKNFIIGVVEDMINGILEPINAIGKKFGMATIKVDFSSAMDKNIDKISELQKQIDANPWNSIKDVWSSFSSAAADNWKKVTGIFSFGMDNLEQKSAETGAIIAGNLTGGGGSGGGGGSSRSAVFTPGKMQTKGPGSVLGTTDTGGLANMDGFLQRQSEKMKLLTQDWEAYLDKVYAVADVIPRITDAFGEMIAGSKAAFKSLVSDMLTGLKRIVNGLFAQAIAGLIANGATKGLIGLASASVGLGVLGALWNSKVPKMATGGIIPNGYNNDTYPAMLSSGEMVVPKPIALGSGIMGMPSEIYLRANYDELMAVINLGNKRRNS